MTNKSALYIVPTPIGNLSDITLRAIEVLKDVSAIAAEDTRHSGKLLQHHGIDTPLISYHDHGGEAQVERILNKLSRGQSVALISDAGTPLISDPGYRVVSVARSRGFQVVPIPGACALITALSAAGLPSDRFSFEGFPPAKHQARLSFYSLLNRDPRTIIFYESTHRIEESIEDLSESFGADRRCVVARELTKTFETFLEGSLTEVLVQIREDSNQKKGEFVVMVDGFSPEDDEGGLDPQSERVLKVLLEELPLKQASAIAAKITGEKKNKLYQWALAQKGE